jgi:hypothetical protein
MTKQKWTAEQAADEIARLETAIETAVAAMDALLPALFDPENFNLDDKLKALAAVHAYRDAAWKIEQKHAFLRDNP